MKYNFDNITIRSKEELNRYVSDEDIITHYFGEFELDTYYPSPRGEKYPSLMFDYYNEELKWRDFGQFNTPRDAIEFVIFVKSLDKIYLDYMPALTVIYNEVERGVCKRVFTQEEKQKNVALKFRRRYYTWELDYWKDYHFTLDILERYKVYPCEIWNNGLLWHRSKKDDPLYVYLWDMQSEIWKGYRPFGETVRISGRYIRKKFFANNIDGHIQGWEYLPAFGPIVVITKSYKDVITLSLLGIPAIAPHSENMFISEATLDNLRNRFEHIYVNYDNDETGVKKSIEYSNKYCIYYWNVPRDAAGCKDPSDMSKKYSLKAVKDSLLDKFNRDKVIIDV